MNLLQLIKGLFRKMIPVKSIEQALNIKIITPSELRKSQLEWRNILAGEAAWNNKNVPSLKLANIAIQELSRSVTVNAESEVTGSTLADYVNSQHQDFFKQRKDLMMAFLGNSRIILKGSPTATDTVEWKIISPEFYFPFRANSKGEYTGVVFAESKQDGDYTYWLLEKCLFENNLYSIEYHAYQSKTENDIGREIPLTSVAEWAHLESMEVDTEFPWFAEVAMKDCEGLERPIFAPAIEWIQQADEQMARLIWENKGGELAVFASRDLLKVKEGIPALCERERRLYRQVGTSHNKDGTTNPVMDTFSPSLRNADLNATLNDFKRAFEDILSLTRSTVSDPQTQARTATEVVSNKPRYAEIVKMYQEILQAAYKKTIAVTADIAERYKFAPPGEITLTFQWDDTILVTPEERRKRIQAEYAILERMADSGAIGREWLVAFWKENSEFMYKITDNMLTDARTLSIGVLELS